LLNTNTIIITNYWLESLLTTVHCNWTHCLQVIQFIWQRPQVFILSTLVQLIKQSLSFL